MAITLDYALLAGSAYNDTRADINRFPIPSGWNVKFRKPEDKSTGFEATVFQSSSEIVISYAGTGGPGDKTADIRLAAGTWSEQLLQAAQLYLDIKADPANAGKTITLTGHSLGGGLAALVSVFFAVPSTTFDQAQWFVQAGTTDAGANVLRGGTCNVGRVTKQNAITSIAARASSMRSTGRFGMYLHPTGRAACVHRKPACKPINHGVQHA